MPTGREKHGFRFNGMVFVAVPDGGAHAGILRSSVVAEQGFEKTEMLIWGIGSKNYTEKLRGFSSLVNTQPRFMCVMDSLNTTSLYSG